MSSTNKTLQITSTGTSGKRKKGSKSPSGGANKTSIVDNLLKDRKSPVGGNTNSKKLVLDLNSDNYIITESKSAKQAKVDAENKAMPIKRISRPVIEPIILAAQEITRSGSPKPSSPSNTPTETRDKLDIFKNIDSVITNRPDKSLSIDLESGPVDNVLEAGSSQGQDPLVETQSKLTAAKDAIAKINDKIKRKGPSEKYTKLLEQLNSKVKKYTRILETPKPLPSKSQSNVPSTLNYKPTLGGLNSSGTSVPRHSQAHPEGWAYNRVSTVPTIAPPTYKESKKQELIGSSQTNKPPTTKPEESRQVYGNVKPVKSTPSPVSQQGKQVVVSEIDSELARARTLLQDSSKSVNRKPTNSSTSQPHASATPVKKKERATVFDVSTSIDTLREKQTHLQEQQRKLQDQYAHKLKQIEKMKSQKAEIQKLQALEAERRKIYEMEQKLKTLEREQWKEQQALRKELHQLGVSNHKTQNSVNAKDRGELFSLKQELASPPTASAGILTYLYDKLSALTKIPMGEVIDIPREQPSSPTNTVVESKPIVEASEVKSTKPIEQPVKNTMTYAGRFVYLVDFPESEFTDGERVIQGTCSDYVIPFDATWLDTQFRDLILDNECLSACNKVGIDGDNNSDNKYIRENYKTRIITNMDLISGSRGIDFYMAIVAQRNGNNRPQEALATLAMFYSLLMFYEVNR